MIWRASASLSAAPVALLKKPAPPPSPPPAAAASVWGEVAPSLASLAFSMMRCM